MAVITIQCRLIAEEKTLHDLWKLMTEPSNLLVSEILEQITIHPELERWINQGYIPFETIKSIVTKLKQQPKFQEIPGRFSISAETLVKEIYQSWFAVQKKKRNQIWGKKRWLEILKSEVELLQITGLSLTQLQTGVVKSRWSD
jgi:hypothetical protein